MFSKADISYIVSDIHCKIYNEMARYGCYTDKNRVFLHLVQGVPKKSNANLTI